MENLEKYRQLIIKAQQKIFFNYKPSVKSLYAPVYYALENGKKIRPICLLITAEAFGQDINNVMPAALAIEMFHNFTLVHDDVMDRSPLRRGKPTVYHKWDINQAILSGDAMLLLVYQTLLQLDEKFIKPATELLTWAGLKVSEGQQLDLEFETKNKVSLNQYLKMIELKTAVLLATSFKMGALLANASKSAQNNIYQFGKNLGLAFQIQDDYLDLYADQNVFGKKIGNDIITHKKTYLFLKALEIADAQTKKTLISTFYDENLPAEQKIEKIKQIYSTLEVPQQTLTTIENLYNLSQKYLFKIKFIDNSARERIWQIAQYLMKRKK